MHVGFRITLGLVGILVMVGLSCGDGDKEKLETLEKHLADLRSENLRLRAMVDAPPASLGKLYPPMAQGPLFYNRMVDLGVALEGTLAEVREGRWDNAQKRFKRFKAVLDTVRTLVPEWTFRYDWMKPAVRQMEQALQRKADKQALAVWDEINQTCYACHLVETPKVQARFRWISFRSLQSQNPKTGEVLPYVKLMKALSLNLSALAMDVADNQKSGAIKYLRRLREHFKLLQGTCVRCHETGPQDYYAGPSIEKLLSQTERALTHTRMDVVQVSGLIESIREESCAGCHWVHIPQAYAKQRWDRREISNYYRLLGASEN